MIDAAQPAGIHIVTVAPEEGLQEGEGQEAESDQRGPMAAPGRPDSPHREQPDGPDGPGGGRPHRPEKARARACGVVRPLALPHTPQAHRLAHLCPR
jgi:hypothetical protein